MEIFILIAGFFSGIVSTWSVEFTVNPLTVWPGIIFGVALVLPFVQVFKWKFWLKAIGFVAASAASYFAAVIVLIYLPSNADGSAPFWVYGLAGLCGAFLLSVSFRFLLNYLSRQQILMAALAGAILGFLGSWGQYLFDVINASTFNPLYVIWQTGMGFVYVACARFNSRQK